MRPGRDGKRWRGTEEIPPDPRLTDRENKILQLITNNYVDREIERILGLKGFGSVSRIREVMAWRGVETPNRVYESQIKTPSTWPSRNKERNEEIYEHYLKYRKPKLTAKFFNVSRGTVNGIITRRKGHEQKENLAKSSLGTPNPGRDRDSPGQT